MLRIGPDIEPGVPWTVSVAPDRVHVGAEVRELQESDFFLRALGRAV